MNSFYCLSLFIPKNQIGTNKLPIKRIKNKFVLKHLRLVNSVHYICNVNNYNGNH